MKNTPQYSEEDVNALEHVSMLIDEYMCCDDSQLTESGKKLKKLVEDFYSQWEKRIEEYVFEERPNTPMDFVRKMEEAHKATKNSKMVFK